MNLPTRKIRAPKIKVQELKRYVTLEDGKDQVVYFDRPHLSKKCLQPATDLTHKQKRRAANLRASSGFARLARKRLLTKITLDTTNFQQAINRATH